MPEPEEIQVEEEAPAQEEQPKPGFSIGKLIEWLLSNMIPIIIAVVLSTVVAFLMIRGSLAKKSEEVYKTVKLAPKPQPLVIFKLDEFRINTADIDEAHFVRLRVNLAYDGKNKKLAQELSQRIEQIRDIIIRVLNSKEKQDIDEPIEKEELKEEIKKQINNILSSGEIEDIYYDEFVIS
ncbi:MAG: flagellar basal body-associated FliL family protein [Brevinematia bacterium]